MVILFSELIRVMMGIEEKHGEYEMEKKYINHLAKDIA